MSELKRDDAIAPFTCSVCRATFMGHVKQAPTICGQLMCRARDGWGDIEWAGQARMARARQASGVPLNDLDRAALALSS